MVLVGAMESLAGQLDLDKFFTFSATLAVLFPLMCTEWLPINQKSKEQQLHIAASHNLIIQNKQGSNQLSFEWDYKFSLDHFSEESRFEDRAINSLDTGTKIVEVS